MNVPAKFEVRSFTRSWDNSEYFKNAVQSLDTPFKVVDFGTNRKRVYDFLLVRNSDLGPILHRFGDIAGFCAPEWPHACTTPILGVFSLHQIAHVGVSAYTGPKLFSREIIFEEFQPMWSRYLNVTDGQTDRQTDNIRSQYRALH